MYEKLFMSDSLKYPSICGVHLVRHIGNIESEIFIDGDDVVDIMKEKYNYNSSHYCMSTTLFWQCFVAEFFKGWFIYAYIEA